MPDTSKSPASAVGKPAAPENCLENYFNYFTEIEERFRQCRLRQTAANPRMLLTPIDWALIESWKEAGIPLSAVLTGIERTFEKWARRPQRFQHVNGLGFCSQQVMQAAEEARTAEIQGGRPRKAKAVEAPFPAEEVAAFFARNTEALERAAERAGGNGHAVLHEDLTGAASSLREIASRAAAEACPSMEEVERRLTALEDKLAASLTRASSVELLAQFRGEVERGIVPYRSKMTGPQIESLERQFLKKRLFEHYEIPRLSLFYL